MCVIYKPQQYSGLGKVGLHDHKNEIIQLLLLQTEIF